MQKAADIIFQENIFFVAGHLNFSNVMSIYQKSLLELNKCSSFEFDFSQLKSSNSAGLALIIEWVKLAKQVNKPIRFFSLSQDLMSIAKVTGLSQLIEESH